MSSMLTLRRTGRVNVNSPCYRLVTLWNLFRVRPVVICFLCLCGIWSGMMISVFFRATAYIVRVQYPSAGQYVIDSVYDHIIYPELTVNPNDGWCHQTESTHQTRWILSKASVDQDNLYFM